MEEERKPSAIWPTFLVVVGLLLLLSNLGILPWSVWAFVWRLWPLLLVFLGLEKLLGSRFSGFLVFILGLGVVLLLVYCLLFFDFTRLPLRPPRLPYFR